MWFREYTTEELNEWPKNNIIGLLGINYTQIGERSLSASMPVDERTCQPFGILHGGSSVVLAESLGSLASFMCIDPEKSIPVGLEVNANHLRPVSAPSRVRGICEAIHTGAKVHVWQINIFDEQERKVCVARLTVAIIPKEK